MAIYSREFGPGAISPTLPETVSRASSKPQRSVVCPKWRKDDELLKYERYKIRNKKKLFIEPDCSLYFTPQKPNITNFGYIIKTVKN